ncbi:unnamed protein product [Clavelina lepadiformis]|uniref:Uncharacterized protein n=1 Tax=Clavelina lepadiformis TaxID=159417 RepID=A0ABP0GDI4_CLALP
MSCESLSNVTCKILAPLSQAFSACVYERWSYGGVVFLTVPPVLSLALLLVYCEEVYYILRKADSKDLRNSLLWILGTFPGLMIIGTVAIFIPRGVVYLSFIYGIFVAYAVYKYYYLIIVFAGGTKSFVDKSAHNDVPLNNIPCCCLVCLPKIKNSERVTNTAKWLILQNVIFTPFFGALGVLLKADSKLYSLEGISASVYLSVLNGAATLVCMYGFKMMHQMTKSIHGMEEVHAIKGKTMCIQLLMVITGFEGMIFNVLAQLDVFPCTPPLNFLSRRRAIYNYAVVIQVFFLGILARYHFRRKDDIQRQAILNDSLTITPGENNAVFTAVDAFVEKKRSYSGTASAASAQPSSGNSSDQSNANIVAIRNDASQTYQGTSSSV